MRHRHLDVEDATPVGELGLAALDDLLDRGDLADWQPLAHAVRSDPWGPVAERVLHLVEHHPMYGTSLLWRDWIARLRAAPEPRHVGRGLGELRRARGVTQRELAARLGTTQPEISKLEQRADVRVSTARAYVAALGGTLALTASFEDGPVEIA